MSGKTILEVESPKTQSIEAVRALLAYVGRGFDPMPSEVSLSDGRLMLVLSNKKDCFYVVTKSACSCPSATYRPGRPCKHQRKFFPEPAKPASCQGEESLISGPFKPFLESDSQKAKAEVV